MAWELADNIRGPKGDKGDPGTISSVSAATVPPGSPAKAELNGKTDVHLHLELPQGEKGEQGPPGTFASASAVSVPADQSASVEVTGSAEVKHLKISVPRGLPGANAVPTDEAIGTLVTVPDSQTRAALDGQYGKKTTVESIVSAVGPGGRLSDTELTTKTQGLIDQSTNFAAAAAIIANFPGVNARG